MKRTLLTAVLLVAAVAMAAPARAIVVVDSKTGLFGVTGGQTIRVSLWNAGNRGGIIPCTRVFDLSGALLAEIEGTPTGPGEGTFVDVNAADFGLREGERMQVRVEVELSPPPNDNRRVRTSDGILTLEVFDAATGRTAFTMPWVLKGFNPQPEPPALRR
jgi:hypothetical protein